MIKLLASSIAAVLLVRATSVSLAAEAPATPPVTAPAPIVKPRLTWAPPTLVEPTTIEINNSIAKHSIRLDKAKDYILKLPATPLKGGITIYGGHNVVLIGGEITVPTPEQDPEFKGQTRGLYLQNQTGTMHVEGVLLSGDGLTEGVNLDQRLGGTVVFENFRVETVHGSFAKNHADVIQTWAGPSELRIDSMTATTGYQGFFLLPLQHFRDGAPPRLFDFRRLNLIGNDKSAYLLWHQNKRDGTPVHPFALQDVWVSPNPKKDGNRDQFLWPKPSTGDSTFNAVQVGVPPQGDFVPPGVAGIGYVSPGYQES